MTSPLAAKATFNRHTACEMAKKQKSFSAQMSSPLSFAVSLTLFCSHTLCFQGDTGHTAWSPSTSPHPSSPSGALGHGLSLIHSPASDAHVNMPSLCLETQLVRGALLCWDETWGWRGTWHTPAASQGCSNREPLPPHKGPWADCISHVHGTWKMYHVCVSLMLQTASAAICAAGGEIQKTPGDCCERQESVLLLC